jgi:hypothetical protein
MTDNLSDTLALVEAARVAHMTKAERADYLRSRGWRRLNSGKQQKWMAPSGLTATLAGAVQLQVLADQGARERIDV